jgi:hypothetical protein
MQRNSKLLAQQLLERPAPHHQRRFFKKPPATTTAAAAAEVEVPDESTGLTPDASSRLELLRQKYGRKPMGTQQPQQQQAGGRGEADDCSALGTDSSSAGPAQAA